MEIPDFGENSKIACFLCGESVSIRRASKSGKPYFICNPCGVQAFIRRERGIGILKALIEMPVSLKDSPGNEGKPNKVLDLLAEIGRVRGKLAKVEAGKRSFIGDLLGPDDGSGLAVDALKGEINRLENKLNKIKDKSAGGIN